MGIRFGGSMRTDLKLITCSILLLSIASSTALGDASTDAASGAAGAISGAALGLTTVINGVNQAQNMASFVGATAKMGTVGTQLGQANAAIAQAMATEAQCETNAKKGKRSASGAALPPNAILGEKVTCSTYNTVWGDALTWLDQFSAANDRFLCIKNMQTAMDAIATGQFKDQLKAYIEAANGAYDSQQSIVTNYDDMAKKIKDDLEGDNGLNNQLQAVDAMINQVQSLISPSSSGAQGASDVSIGGQGFAGDLAGQVDNLKISSNKTANDWMKGILSDAINGCFVGDSNMPCRINGPNGTSLMSPLACLASATNQSFGANQVQGELNNGNSANISSLIQQQQDILQNSISAGNLNALDPKAFKQYVNNQLAQALTNLSSTFDSLALNGSSVSPDTLKNFYQSSMKTCFKRAMNNFDQDMNSQGPKYYAGYYQVDSAKKKILSIETQATNTVTKAMNRFLTRFSKSYSTGLSQFAANCSATTDPTAGLDCLRELKAQLESGINGTTAYAQLSTGGTWTANPSPTTITLQHLTLDTNGSPTTVPDQQTCVGFEACITLMQQREDYDVSQSSAYKQKLVSFAKATNAQITNVIGAASASFAIAAGKVTSAVADLSSSLAALGVPATAGITMKKADPASLTKDKDRNNLFSSDPMPDAKGLLGVSDMDPESVTANAKATTDLKNKVLDKKNEAMAMTGYCSLIKSDYDDLDKVLGSNNCRAPYANLCSPNSEKRFITLLSGMMRNGQENGSKPSDSGSDSSDSANEVKSDLADCRSQANSACSGNSDDCSDEAAQKNIAQAAMNANSNDSTVKAYSAAVESLDGCKKKSGGAAGKLACQAQVNAGCVAEVPSTFNFKERTPELANGNGSILDAYSNLMQACAMTTPAATSSSAYTDADATCDLGAPPTTKKCACEVMHKKITDAKGAVPDAMSKQDESATSDKGINNSNDFTNGFKKAN